MFYENKKQETTEMGFGQSTSSGITVDESAPLLTMATGSSRFGLPNITHGDSANFRSLIIDSQHYFRRSRPLGGKRRRRERSRRRGRGRVAQTEHRAVTSSQCSSRANTDHTMTGRTARVHKQTRQTTRVDKQRQTSHRMASTRGENIHSKSVTTTPVKSVPSEGTTREDVLTQHRSSTEGKESQTILSSEGTAREIISEGKKTSVSRSTTESVESRTRVATSSQRRTTQAARSSRVRVRLVGGKIVKESVTDGQTGDTDEQFLTESPDGELTVYAIDDRRPEEEVSSQLIENSGSTDAQALYQTRTVIVDGKRYVTRHKISSDGSISAQSRIEKRTEDNVASTQLIEEPGDTDGPGLYETRTVIVDGKRYVTRHKISSDDTISAQSRIEKRTEDNVASTQLIEEPGDTDGPGLYETRTVIVDGKRYVTRHKISSDDTISAQSRIEKRTEDNVASTQLIEEPGDTDGPGLYETRTVIVDGKRYVTRKKISSDDSTQLNVSDLREGGKRTEGETVKTVSSRVVEETGDFEGPGVYETRTVIIGGKRYVTRKKISSDDITSTSVKTVGGEHTERDAFTTDRNVIIEEPGDVDSPGVYETRTVIVDGKRYVTRQKISSDQTHLRKGESKIIRTVDSGNVKDGGQIDSDVYEIEEYVIEGDGQPRRIVSRSRQPTEDGAIIRTDRDSVSATRKEVVRMVGSKIIREFHDVDTEQVQDRKYVIVEDKEQSKNVHRVSNVHTQQVEHEQKLIKDDSSRTYGTEEYVIQEKPGDTIPGGPGKETPQRPDYDGERIDTRKEVVRMVGSKIVKDFTDVDTRQFVTKEQYTVDGNEPPSKSSGTREKPDDSHRPDRPRDGKRFKKETVRIVGSKIIREVTEVDSPDDSETRQYDDDGKQKPRKIIPAEQLPKGLDDASPRRTRPLAEHTSSDSTTTEYTDSTTHKTETVRMVGSKLVKKFTDVDATQVYETKQYTPVDGEQTPRGKKRGDTSPDSKSPVFPKTGQTPGRETSPAKEKPKAGHHEPYPSPKHPRDEERSNTETTKTVGSHIVRTFTDEDTTQTYETRRYVTDNSESTKQILTKDGKPKGKDGTSPDSKSPDPSKTGPKPQDTSLSHIKTPQDENGLSPDSKHPDYPREGKLPKKETVRIVGSKIIKEFTDVDTTHVSESRQVTFDKEEQHHLPKGAKPSKGDDTSPRKGKPVKGDGSSPDYPREPQDKYEILPDSKRPGSPKDGKMPKKEIIRMVGSKIVKELTDDDTFQVHETRQYTFDEEEQLKKMLPQDTKPKGRPDTLPESSKTRPGPQDQTSPHKGRPRDEDQLLPGSKRPPQPKDGKTPKKEIVRMVGSKIVREFTDDDSTEVYETRQYTIDDGEQPKKILPKDSKPKRTDGAFPDSKSPDSPKSGPRTRDDITPQKDKPQDEDQLLPDSKRPKHPKDGTTPKKETVRMVGSKIVREFTDVDTTEVHETRQYIVDEGEQPKKSIPKDSKPKRRDDASPDSKSPDSPKSGPGTRDEIAPRKGKPQDEDQLLPDSKRPQHPKDGTTPKKETVRMVGSKIVREFTDVDTTEVHETRQYIVDDGEQPKKGMPKELKPKRRDDTSPDSKSPDSPKSGPRTRDEIAPRKGKPQDEDDSLPDSKRPLYPIGGQETRTETVRMVGSKIVREVTDVGATHTYETRHYIEDGDKPSKKILPLDGKPKPGDDRFPTSKSPDTRKKPRDETPPSKGKPRKDEPLPGSKRPQQPTDEKTPKKEIVRMVGSKIVREFTDVDTTEDFETRQYVVDDEEKPKKITPKDSKPKSPDGTSPDSKYPDSPRGVSRPRDEISPLKGRPQEDEEPSPDSKRPQYPKGGKEPMNETVRVVGSKIVREFTDVGTTQVYHTDQYIVDGPEQPKKLLPKDAKPKKTDSTSPERKSPEPGKTKDISPREGKPQDKDSPSPDSKRPLRPKDGKSPKKETVRMVGSKIVREFTDVDTTQIYETRQYTVDEEDQPKKILPKDSKPKSVDGTSPDSPKSAPRPRDEISPLKGRPQEEDEPSPDSKRPQYPKVGKPKDTKPRKSGDTSPERTSPEPRETEFSPRKSKPQEVDELSPDILRQYPKGGKRPQKETVRMVGSKIVREFTDVDTTEVYETRDYTYEQDDTPKRILPEDSRPKITDGTSPDSPKEISPRKVRPQEEPDSKRPQRPDDGRSPKKETVRIVGSKIVREFTDVDTTEVHETRQYIVDGEKQPKKITPKDEKPKRPEDTSPDSKLPDTPKRAPKPSDRTSPRREEPQEETPRDSKRPDERTKRPGEPDSPNRPRDGVFPGDVEPRRPTKGKPSEERPHSPDEPLMPVVFETSATETRQSSTSVQTVHSTSVKRSTNVTTEKFSDTVDYRGPKPVQYRPNKDRPTEDRPDRISETFTSVTDVQSSRKTVDETQVRRYDRTSFPEDQLPKEKKPDDKRDTPKKPVIEERCICEICTCGIVGDRLNDIRGVNDVMEEATFLQH
ncbi:hypothetical protein AAG570_007836 [Ranatra chinensis]|uniref:Uncharacterized protein n=1 Tax=Ranatra chinensis TaxID=642074 RepID=A0ABD0XUX8_9HEMI